jgi:dihydroorotate dehydrogenase
VYPLADYVTVNISSPNTAGLRELQEEQALRRLVGTLREAQERPRRAARARGPMLVKIAPDLSDEDIDAAGRVLTDLEVDGVIATNTHGDALRPGGVRHANEAGGLSGEPLMGKSTLVLRRLRTRLPETIPMIGVGGILSGADAAAKAAAGATLVQTYTGWCIAARRWSASAWKRSDVERKHPVAETCRPMTDAAPAPVTSFAR